MEKRKHRKQITRPPEKLFFASSFEFVSPLPVEECAYRLRRIERSGFFDAETISFLFSETENTYRFSLRQMTVVPVGWTIGKLLPLDQSSTRVNYRIGLAANEAWMILTFVPPLLYFAVGLLLLLYAFSAATLISMLVGIGVWIAIFGFIVLISLRKTRSSVVKLLRENLIEATL